MKEVKRTAYAKINLGLDVVGKREDGYHNLSMVMTSIEVHDKLRLKAIKKDAILMKTNLNYLPTDDRNLVVRIVRYMRDQYKIKSGVFIDLYKVIPVGAGLAGGSSDGAQAILGMNQLFDLGLTIEEMMAIGKLYGADIPYCVRGGTMLAEGIGDILTPIDHDLCLDLLVVKPKISVPTPMVFKVLKADEISWHPDIEALIQGLKSGDLRAVTNHLGNVLEPVTFELYEEVLKVKEAMEDTGALGVLMSGSGSAIFAVYASRAQASKAAKALNRHPLIKQIFVTRTISGS